MKRRFNSILITALCSTVLVAGCGTSHKGGSTTGGKVCPSTCQSGCDAQGMCHDCSTPGVSTCAGGNVVACTAQGTFGDVMKSCDVMGGETCMGGNCLSACDV